MSYTDQELRAFTQVAYADLGRAYDVMRSRYPDRDTFTIDELKSVATPSEISSLSCLTDDQCRTWSISAVHDTNSKNGFYACVIETSPGNAAVAFRGSEDMKDPGNFVNDWLLADLGLLNSTMTNQHKETERFLRQNSDLLSRYDNISMTGHSLGGNLADYATLVSHKYGLDSRIKQCANFDGPGFSNEFIMTHMNDINRMKGVMKHYQWSLVGNMLFNLPGVENINCKLSPDADSHMFYRHHTKFLMYDENGNVIKGDKDLMSWFASGISKGIDFSTGMLGIYGFFFITYALYTEFKDEIEQFFDDIISGIQSVYSDIKAGIKKLFGMGSDYFRVNTNMLSRDSESVRTLIDRVKNDVSEMFNSVEALNGMWTGSANRAFSAKFAAEQKSINDYLNQILKYGGILEKDSDEYNRSEKYAVDLIATLRF